MDKPPATPLRNRKILPNRANETTDVDSDIVETSAVDFTSGDNNGHDSLDDSDDEDISKDHDGEIEGNHQDFNSDIDHNNPSAKVSKDANNNTMSSRASQRTENSEVIAHGIGTTRGVGAKLISRRRRSHRRRRNTNDFGDYDHDGDIDRSGDDEADNDCNTDDCDSDSNSDNDDNATNHNPTCNRWRQENKTTIFLRLRAVQRSRVQQELKVQDLGCNGDRLKSSSPYDLPGFDGICNNQKQPTNLDRNSSHRHVSLSHGIRSLLERTLLYVRELIPGSSTPERQRVVGSKKWSQSKHKKSAGIYSNSPDKQISLDNPQPKQHQANMPGNSSRYQTLHGFDEYRPSRRISNSNRHNKSRESQRLVDSNGYSKLSHHYYHHQESAQSSVLQEIKRIILLVAIISICCFLLWKLHDVLTEDYNFLGVVETSSELGKYKHYAVSTDAKPCSKVGRDLLAKGGSAVDSAIGTLICMGLALPNSLGLGGGCLMTIYDREKKEAVVIDGREVAPSYAHEKMFADNPLSASRGPLSVGVPGEIAAYWKAHQLYGKLNWSELFDESIKMADEGFPIVSHLSLALRNRNHAQYITPPLAKFFTNNQTSEYYYEGEILQQKTMAETLRRIRDNGEKEFYGGLTGQLLVEDLRKQGGNITMDDLMKYRVQVREPLKFDLADDLKLYTQPLPGSGIVLSVILRVMKELGYYKGIKPQVSLESASLYYHRLVEAYKFAYAQRAGLEDKPDDPDRLAKLMGKLMSEDYIKEVAGKIDNVTHDNSYYGGSEFFGEDHGTAHVSVMDNDGNAVAVTSSVNLYFGSGLYSPSTGIIYNDVMDDFVSPNITNKFKLHPSKYNRIRPGKRPLSSMSPSIFTDSEGNVKLIIGASGGTMITTSIASVSLRNCFLGEDIKTAIDGPRLHHQFVPNQVNYEPNFYKDLLHTLEQRHHQVLQNEGRSSVVMAIANRQVNDTKYITANSDHRKGGSVDGL